MPPISPTTLTPNPDSVGKVQLLAPNLTARFITEAVQTALSRLAPPPHGIKFETIEMTMQVLYQAGEMASMQGVAYEWIQALMAQANPTSCPIAPRPHR